MQENRYLLDANAVLRFLLQDNEEQLYSDFKYRCVVSSTGDF